METRADPNKSKNIRAVCEVKAIAEEWIPGDFDATMWMGWATKYWQISLKMEH